LKSVWAGELTSESIESSIFPTNAMLALAVTVGRTGEVPVGHVLLHDLERLFVSDDDALADLVEGDHIPEADEPDLPPLIVPPQRGGGSRCT
jgi:hypothetical protein